MANLGPYGGITIDGVQLTTDPTRYEPLRWKKRTSFHQVIGPPGTPGPAVIQDRGVTQVDDVVMLEGENPITDDVKAALHTRYRTKGQQYSYTDWVGNTFQVFIEDFQPRPYKTGGTAAGVKFTLWLYTLTLRVVSISQLDGVAYAES